MDGRLILEKYRDLQITSREFKKLSDGIKESLFLDDPVLISSHHIINLLNRYKVKDISSNELLDWVNVIAFRDWYSYQPDESDVIACIINQLESLDEHDNELNLDEIDNYIYALQHNKDLHVID